MKAIRYIAFLLAPLLAGCFAEDESMCDNLKLHFHFADGVHGIDTLLMRISTVDVMIYDAGGNPVLAHDMTLERTQMGYFQGVYLTLKPGKYYLHCMGNVHDDRQHNASFGSPTVGYADADERGQIDSVYHAALVNAPVPPPTRAHAHHATRATNVEDYAIIIPDEGDWQGHAAFSPAHRQVEVCTRGFGDPRPDIALDNLPAEFHLYDRTMLGDAVSRKRPADTTVMIAGRAFAMSQFRTLWFDRGDNNVSIRVLARADGHTLYAKPLNDAIVEALKGVEEDIAKVWKATTLRVIIEQTADGKVAVYINVRNWESGDVGVGFN